MTYEDLGTQGIFDPNNADPRCACVLVLDTSSSMEGAAIDQLNAGLAQFIKEVSKDKTARTRVEVAIVTFGPAQVVQVFAPIDHIRAPKLVANNNTPMGSALNLAIDCLQDRKALYRSNGMPYYRPWIFLITDGAPTDGDAWQHAAQRIKAEEERKGLSFFAVGVEGADMQVLNSIGMRPAIKLKGYSFAEMFKWLSASLERVSSSQPTDEVKLPPADSWGQI